MKREVRGTRIKICGLSRPEDISYVNEARPDYCGFIIHVPKSMRNTTPDQVRSLCAGLSKDILPVGVFVNEPIETVASLLLDGTIAVAQLHGQEGEAYIETLRGLIRQGLENGSDNRKNKDKRETREKSPEIWKAFRAPALPSHGQSDTVEALSFEKEVAQWVDSVMSCSADLVLLDQGDGGTGKSFDWTLALGITRPYLLAGGIGIDNVTEAIRQLQPYGVDVSSSVESGNVKEKEKILEMVKKVRETQIHSPDDDE